MSILVSGSLALDHLMVFPDRFKDHILPEKIPDFAERFGYGEFVRLEQVNPSCARMMKGGEFFREFNRISLRQDDDPSAEFQRLGLTGQECEPCRGISEGRLRR